MLIPSNNKFHNSSMTKKSRHARKKSENIASGSRALKSILDNLSFGFGDQQTNYYSKYNNSSTNKMKNDMKWNQTDRSNEMKLSPQINNSTNTMLYDRLAKLGRESIDLNNSYRLRY